MTKVEIKEYFDKIVESQRELAGLSHGKRSASAPSCGRLIPRARQAEDAENFGLVTWLMIREAACAPHHPA
jgi:hypothetical protein